MLYILLSCVLTLSQMFPTMFQPREIKSHFNQGNGAFTLVYPPYACVTVLVVCQKLS